MSFDVRWEGHGERQHLTDTMFGFVGEFVAGASTISFTAKDDEGNVVFSSNPEGQLVAGPPAAVGHERNGVFFR